MIKTASNNREEIGAVLAGAVMTVFAHYSPGWSPTEIASLTAAVVLAIVYGVGFLPRPKGSNE